MRKKILTSFINIIVLFIYFAIDFMLLNKLNESNSQLYYFTLTITTILFAFIFLTIQKLKKVKKKSKNNYGL